MLLEVNPDSAYLKSELETARFIRNHCKEFMTGNQKYISQEHQESWYNGLDHKVTRLYLYFYRNAAVGYGLIRMDHGVPLLTGAVLEVHRGHGYGRHLFQSLIDESAKITHQPPELLAWRSNARALNLYRSLGFVEDFALSNDDKVHMYLETS